MNKNLKIELEMILEYLNHSYDSTYANSTVEEIKNIINETISKISESKKIYNKIKI
jgi:hypothetical protein